MANDNGQPKILIVDDEEIVTTSLRNLFHLRTDYRAVTFTSPAEALAGAKDVLFDLVISDYLMPGMDGIRFLGHFKETQPQAVRILLTGYADKQNAILAINEVGLYQYIEKPWDNAALLMVVKNAIEKGALLRSLEQKVIELQKANRSLQDFQNQLIRAFI